MSFEFKDQLAMLGGFKVKNIEGGSVSINDTWEMPWGEQRAVNNHFNETIIKLEEQEPPARPLNIYCRAYNDGIGFASPRVTCNFVLKNYSSLKNLVGLLVASR